MGDLGDEAIAVAFGTALAARMGVEEAAFAGTLAGAVVRAALAAAAGAMMRPPTCLLQSGHDVTVGGRIGDLLRMGGLRPRPVGAVDRCDAALLGSALPGACLALFVDRPGMAPGLLALPDFLWACCGQGVPVLAVAAGNRDADALLDAGCDLVAWEMAGLGVLAGRSALLAADPAGGAAALAADPGRLREGWRALQDRPAHALPWTP